MLGFVANHSSWIGKFPVSMSTHQGALLYCRDRQFKRDMNVELFSCAGHSGIPPMHAVALSIGSRVEDRDGETNGPHVQ